MPCVPDRVLDEFGERLLIVCPHQCAFRIPRSVLEEREVIVFPDQIIPELGSTMVYPEVRRFVFILLHEIAHALAGVKHGHGPAWKAVCRRIGADPTRLDRTATLPDAPYELFCPGCKMVIARRHRRIRRSVLRRSGCRRCGRPSVGRLTFRRRITVPDG